MKTHQKILLGLLTGLSMASAAMAQDNSALIVSARYGENFMLSLNGQAVNAQSANAVTIKQITPTKHIAKIQVLSTNGNTYTFTKKMRKPLYADKYYIVKSKGRKGKYKARGYTYYTGSTSTTNTVYVYNNGYPTADTYTNTTIMQQNSTNDTYIYNQNTNTTTNNSTKTTTTPKNDATQTQPTDSRENTCQTASMTDAEVDIKLQTIGLNADENARLGLLKRDFGTACVSAAQIVKIQNTLTYEPNRVDISKTLYGRCVNIPAFEGLVVQNLKYEWAKNDLKRHIAEANAMVKTAPNTVTTKINETVALPEKVNIENTTKVNTIEVKAPVKAPETPKPTPVPPVKTPEISKPAPVPPVKTPETPKPTPVPPVKTSETPKPTPVPPVPPVKAPETPKPAPVPPVKAPETPKPTPVPPAKTPETPKPMPAPPVKTPEPPKPTPAPPVKIP